MWFVKTAAYKHSYIYLCNSVQLYINDKNMVVFRAKELFPARLLFVINLRRYRNARAG